MSRRIRPSFFVVCLLLYLFALGALAQTTVPSQRLLLLIAGPSGDRIDPQETAVVEHLNGLRGEYGFTELQMGTMHYDRPQEAVLLKNVLGFSPNKGVTVGLVQLSEQGVPVRTLYKVESVTKGKLLAAQNDLLSRWSSTTGQPLPPGLRPTAANSSPATSGTSPLTPAYDGTIYSKEGIRYVIQTLDDQVSALWGTFRNAPIREDGNDLVLREETKAFSEATAALRATSDLGVILPLEELMAVARAGRKWAAAEPQYFLPVPLRQQVKPLNGLLKMVDEISAQGMHQQQNQP